MNRRIALIASLGEAHIAASRGAGGGDEIREAEWLPRVMSGGWDLGSGGG